MFVDRSTVDYFGHYKGIPVAFDAKECSTTSINFKTNFKEHQTEFLEYWSACGAHNQPIISGYLIWFKKIDIDNLYFLDINTYKNLLDKEKLSAKIEDIKIKVEFNNNFIEEILKCSALNV